MLIRELANRVAKEMRDGDSFSPMVIEGSILELIATFGRMYEAGNRRDAIPDWLKQCREMLEFQPGVGATHEELALHFKKHPVHVAKAFRKAYGETIGECQRRVRLSKAESLLRKRNMALADIALQCGFSSQSHFSRCFKCAFGTTPSRYRAERS
jgi:AraC family transcriptional regulator